MNFFNGFWITGFNSLVITVIAFLNNVIVTRSLGPGGRGIYAIISNLILLVMVIFGEGLRRSNTVFIGRESRNLFSLVKFSIGYCCVLALILCLILLLKPLYNSLLPNISTLLVILGFAIAVFSIFWQSIQALFLGLQKIIDFNLMMLIQIVAVLFFNICGILIFDFGVREFISSLLMGAVLTSVIGLVKLRNNKIDSSTEQKIKLREIFSVTGKSMVASVSTFMTLRGDIFLINYFLNPFQAGLYSVAVMFSEILQRVPNVIGPLVISKAVNDFSLKPAFDTIRLIRVVFAFNILVVLVLFFTGKIIITLLFGIDFIDAYEPLLYLLPALFFIGPGGIAHAYFMGKAYPAMVIWINLLTAILNISLNIIFIPIYGISAAALISSLTYALWAISLVIYLGKKSNISITKILFLRIEDLNYLINKLRITGLGRN